MAGVIVRRRASDYHGRDGARRPTGAPEERTMSQRDPEAGARLDFVRRGGRVLDPGRGVDAALNVGIAAGRIGRLGPTIARGAAVAD